MGSGMGKHYTECLYVCGVRVFLSCCCEDVVFKLCYVVLGANEGEKGSNDNCSKIYHLVRSYTPLQVL